MTQPNEYDSPWKEALERYLESFFALFFPAAHAEIDWGIAPIFLDKELQQAVHDAAIGRRVVDKLVQVWRSDGAATWVLVHVEIQSQEEVDFAERMFVYHYRLRDRYRRQIVSLAVLGDERPAWRPDSFGYGLWDCTLTFTFPVVKLLDYSQRRADLVASRNPFATVVLAHLAAQETRQDLLSRAQVKFALTRRLYEVGYDRDRVNELYRFIDWMLQLPADLEVMVWEQLQAYEQEAHMPYLTYAERIGIEKGRSEGLNEGLVEGRKEGLTEGRKEGLTVALELKFGDAAQALVEEIRQINDLETIQRLMETIKTATTPDEVRRVYTPPAP